MNRLALCICIVVGCGGSSPVMKPVVTEPAKPAPEPEPDALAEFTVWLDAFNAGNEQALAAFTTNRIAPELAKDFPAAAQLLRFRDDTGGFDVRTQEEATAKRFVAIVKERGADQFARVVFELDASHRVATFDINVVPTPDEFKPARLSEADAIVALRTELDALVAKDSFSGCRSEMFPATDSPSRHSRIGSRP